MLNRTCEHCLHTDVITPFSNGLYSSSADFCTSCESPWSGPSIDCEHCGTSEKLMDEQSWENFVQFGEVWKSFRS